MFLDELEDEVTGSSECDVVGHAPWHAGMQDGNELAFGVEDGCARVAFGGKAAVLRAEVEDRDLPGITPELVTRISNSEKRPKVRSVDCPTLATMRLTSPFLSKGEGLATLRHRHSLTA